MAVSNGTESGWYTTECDECTFTLPTRYHDLTSVGCGVFGRVVRAVDTETGSYVAIKKLIQPFNTPIHALRTYRELNILRELNHPDANVIQLYNVFTDAETIDEFTTVYMVFNYVHFNLDDLVKRKVPFPEDHIKLIIYGILRGTKFINSAGVIHRDIKPVNIGSDKDDNISILDFGLARTEFKGIQTGYVATRWWRAPEIFVNWEQYDSKIDIWSVGCIMAELILLTPIFCGRDYLDQLDKIFDLIGTPDLQTLAAVCTEGSQNYISRLTPKTKKDFHTLFGYKYNPDNSILAGVSPEGIDLLDRLLSFDPRKRPTPEEALAHPFLAKYHDSNEEPTRSRIVDPHDNANYSVNKWKSIIWQLIQDFESPKWIQKQAKSDS